MAWWIKPREIVDDGGRPTGRWRLTATSDEDGGGTYRLCECEGGHENSDAAMDCAEARAAKERYG